MIKNQALGGRSSKGLLFLGLFLGVVSAALVVVYLSQADGGGGDVSSGVATPVVVVNQDISPGIRITEEMVAIKEISADAVLADAYRETGDVVGQIVRVPLVAGEQVIPSKVTATGASITDVDNPPLAYVVPAGQRAVAIQVSGVIAASGLIRPGDYVDVILSVRVETDEEGETGTTAIRTSDQMAAVILQNAQVLSVERDVALTGVSEDADGAASVAEEGDENADATTVTLAVSPTHAEVLTVAETCGQNFGGRLALALRGLGDSEPVGTRSVWPEGGAPPNCAALLGLTSLS